MEKIMVSIVCNTYNQEKYIGQCLESLVNQKTDYKYEILVNDDASTDNTPNIVREYEKRYPELVKPIYQKENIYSNPKISLSWDVQYPRAKGKYLAFCEGDDYWCDEYKLQKQVDAMEKYPECTICTCRVRFMNEAGEPLEEYRPEMGHPIKAGLQDSSWLISRTPEYIFQLASVMIDKQRYFDFVASHKDLVAITGVSRVMMFTMFSIGKCYYFEEPMSMYRVNSMGSWTQGQKNINKQVNHYKTISDFYKAFDKYLKEEYADYNNLDLSGLYKTIDYNDVFVATHTHQWKLLFTKRYRKILKNQFTFKNRILYYFIAMFPKLSKGLVK